MLIAAWVHRALECPPASSRLFLCLHARRHRRLEHQGAGALTSPRKQLTYVVSESTDPVGWSHRWRYTVLQLVIEIAGALTLLITAIAGAIAALRGLVGATADAIVKIAPLFSGKVNLRARALERDKHGKR
jgi:hypothetical protein